MTLRVGDRRTVIHWGHWGRRSRFVEDKTTTAMATMRLKGNARRRALMIQINIQLVFKNNPDFHIFAHSRLLQRTTDLWEVGDFLRAGVRPSILDMVVYGSAREYTALPTRHSSTWLSA